MPSVPTPSTSGIVEATNGERHIPASIRADGSKRREIKIKPGYKPPEDVETYRNRTAEAFRNRSSGGVPGADGLKDDKEEISTASNKNAKRREARKKAKAAEEEKASADGNDKEPTKLEDPVDLEVEKEKKARNLRKKLKQAKELKEKRDCGTALLPEQFAKVIKINELIRELDALGFDADGEPKAKENDEKA